MQLVEGTCVKMRVKSKNLKFILVLLKYDVDLHVIGLIYGENAKFLPKCQNVKMKREQK